MENRKELIKKFRSQVEHGKYAGRYTLLAYAYLRGVSYIALERTINEDLFGTNGRNSFLIGLADVVAGKICEADFGKSYWELRKEDQEKQKTLLGKLIKPEEKSKAFAEQKMKLVDEVFKWIQEKYKYIEEHRLEEDKKYFKGDAA